MIVLLLDGRDDRPDHVGRAARSRHASRSTSTRWRPSRRSRSSSRLGSVTAARDFKLEQRVTDAVATLRKRSREPRGQGCESRRHLLRLRGPHDLHAELGAAHGAQRGRAVHRPSSAPPASNTSPPTRSAGGSTTSSAPSAAGDGVRRRDVGRLPRALDSRTDTARAGGRLLLDRAVHGCHRGRGAGAAHHGRARVVRSGRCAARHRHRAASSCTSG